MAGSLLEVGQRHNKVAGWPDTRVRKGVKKLKMQFICSAAAEGSFIWGSPCFFLYSASLEEGDVSESGVVAVLKHPPGTDISVRHSFARASQHFTSN